MSEPTAEEWAEIARRLQEPFDPRDVEFRPQGKLTGEGKGRAIAYVDARVVAARLDAVVGAQHWEFYWEPVILDTAVRVVKGTIVIHGVSKSDIGDGERTEPNKAAVSDALKRTAVLWGPGRYLYHLEAEWVQGKPGQGDNWYISDAELNRLRGKLPKSGVQPAPEPPGRPQSAQANTRLASDSQRGTAPAQATPAGNGQSDLEADQQRVRAVLLRRKGGADPKRADVTEQFATHVDVNANYGNATPAQWHALAEALEAESPADPDEAA